MKTYLLIGIDPFGVSNPSVLVSKNGVVEAVDVTNKQEREAQFGADAERLYQDVFRFCAVWQEGWTWEQFHAEQKRLDFEKEEYERQKARLS